MITVDFKVDEGAAELYNDRVKTADIISKNGTINVKIKYDFREVPLELNAEAHTGDSVRLDLYPFRIDLFVNGKLCDEEWPAGKTELSVGNKVKGDFSVEIKKQTDSSFRKECVNFTRKNIKTPEIRIPGVNIGDCMPYSDSDSDGRYHLFYLYDRHHHASKWGFGAHQWAHVSTKDFSSWDEYPMAVGITEDWEGSICTGSVCRAKDNSGIIRWYAWYAVRMSDRSPARITCAVSEDLIHFKKCGRYFSMPEGYEPTSARDPKVFYLDGKYHMFVTTSRMSDNSGCLAHLVNDEMSIDGWKDEGIVADWADVIGKDDPTRNWQPECPDFFKLGKYYYIVFGIGGTSRYGYSERPFDGFVYPENNTIPCGNVPKSAFLPESGELIFSGFIGDGKYGGKLCACKAEAQPDGRLSFCNVEL